MAIGDHAVLGNKRTAALVACDGTIDWLAHPTLAAPSVFAAILDAERGGACTLAPVGPFESAQRYRPGTNVVETTFRTAEGQLRVTDAFMHPPDRRPPFNQVVRRIDGLAGEVGLRWSVTPRFGYGARRVTPQRLGPGLPCFVDGATVLAVEAHGLGEEEHRADSVAGAVTVRDGDTAVLALGLFEDEPLSWTSRDGLLRRVEETADMWARFADAVEYDGPWREAVVRSALALDLLVDETTGGIAAAATMGLPEAVGGERNFDYRYAWLRDASLTLEAMSRIGLRDQVHVSMDWMLQATASSHPRLRPMYRLDGTASLPDEPLPLSGYGGSRPVLLGNGAQGQLQLGNFGDVLAMTRRFVEHGSSMHPDARVRLGEVVDHLCRVWDTPDAGIWELDPPQRFTQSTLACSTALDAALWLASRGELPSDHACAWRATRTLIEAHLDTHCWDSRRGAWARAADGDELDAGVLLGSRDALLSLGRDRAASTVAALRRELRADGEGALLYRYTGMAQAEGAFVVCSFWLAETLARLGDVDEAAAVFDVAAGCANEVGLLSEEVDPATGEALGNVPQALSHLGLINAAVAIREAG